MSDSRSGSNFWPFLLGFLAGAVVGVLFAPAKGEESRKKLKRRAQEAKEKYGPVVAEIKEKVAPVVEDLSEKAQPIFRRIDKFGHVLKEEVAESLAEEDLDLESKISTRVPEAEVKNQKVETPKAKRKLYFHNVHR